QRATLFYPRSRACSERARTVWVVEQCAQRARERRTVAPRDHDTSRPLARGEEIGNAVRIGGNERQAARHRLEGRDGESFVSRREGEHVARREVTTQGRPILHELVAPRGA